MDRVTTLLIAVVLDLIFGEPPEKIHPTVWFGKIVGFFDEKYGRRSCWLDFAVGSFLVVILIVFSVCIVYLAEKAYLDFYLLFTSISMRSMVEHAKRTIDDGRIVRSEVQKIVSRDVSNLSEPLLSSAVIESLAENFVDGVFAPLFYYTLFGTYGAVVYRALNTCDAMIGYKTERYSCFGRMCARLDDVLNFIPARLSVLLFALLKPKAFETVRRYRTIKLNGGYPISAMAGVLGVTLLKPGCYEVRAGKFPSVEDVMTAIDVYKKLCLMTVVLYTLINFPVESITYLPNLGFISGIVLCSTPIR